MSDPADFEELVLRHQGAVCAVAYAVLRDRARSEEVAQEAFLIAWQKLPAMTTPPKLPAWICGIARNLAANAARRRKETTLETEPITTATPLDAVLDAETDRLARAALASLPERDRDVLVLYYRGDESLAQVATDLGISEVAARQRLHRGRERLKAAFGAVEKTLRATRPGPAFAGACVAALATRGSVAHAAGARVGRRAMWFVPPAIAIVGIGVWSIARVAGTDAPEVARAATPPSVGSRSAGVAASDTLAPHRLDRDARAAARSRIAAARGVDDVDPAARANAASGAGASPERVKVYDFAGSVLGEAPPLPAPSSNPPSDKTVLRRAIRAIEPLLVECYRSAPRAAGTIEVKLHVVGDGVGAIVDAVELGGDAALVGDRELAECMRETWLSLELPAMTGADAWDVHYPLVVGRVR